MVLSMSSPTPSIEAPGVVRVTVRRSVDTTAPAEELDGCSGRRKPSDAHGLADLSEAAVRGWRVRTRLPTSGR